MAVARVFLAFNGAEHRDAVLAALESLGPWPDADLRIPDDGGAVLEAYGTDQEGAFLLVERRLMVALAGTGMHPEGVTLLGVPPRVT